MTRDRELRRFHLAPHEHISIRSTKIDWPVVHSKEGSKVETGLEAADAIPWLQLHFQLEAVERLEGVLERASEIATTMLHAVRTLERLVSWRPWWRGSGT